MANYMVLLAIEVPIYPDDRKIMFWYANPVLGMIMLSGHIKSLHVFLLPLFPGLFSHLVALLCKFNFCSGLLLLL